MEKRVRPINWTCPACGSHKISMVADITQETPIVGFYEDQDEPIFAPEQSRAIDAIPPYKYHCDHCGHVIATGTDEDFIDAIIEYVGEPLEVDFKDTHPAAPEKKLDDQS